MKELEFSLFHYHHHYPWDHINMGLPKVYQKERLLAICLQSNFINYEEKIRSTTKKMSINLANNYSMDIR